MKCDVIVTYCWNRVGYNILKSLYNRGLKVVVGDTSKINICSMSHYCAGSFVYADPFEREDEFIEDLRSAIDKYKPQVLIPTHDESLIIAKNIERLPSNVKYAIDSYTNQYKLSDKLTSTDIAMSVGVPTPTVIDNGVISNYPVVIKTRFGNSAKGVFIVNSDVEVNKLLRRYRHDDIIIEEFFKGRDYSVDCVKYNNFFTAATYKSLVTKTEGGGTTTQREIVSMPHLEEYSRKILDSVNYMGVCGIDFKVNEATGEVAFIEVNARYTGGLATQIAAGFDIPWIHYCLVTSGSFEDSINVRIGTKTKWILGDVITFVGRLLHLKFASEEMKQIFRIKGFDAFDDYDKEDKKAIIGELIYYFSKLIRNGALNP